MEREDLAQETRPTGIEQRLTFDEEGRVPKERHQEREKESILPRLGQGR